MALPTLWDIMTRWVKGFLVQGVPEIVTASRVAPPTVRAL